MQSMVRALGAVLVTSALVVGAGPIAVAAPAFQVGAVDWQPCEEMPEVDCGFLELPVDYARPEGEKFRLAVSRRKADDPSRRIGSLVIGPGGPGGSGVSFTFDAERRLSEEILARFDVVGFDPRGVARSAPVICSVDLWLQRPSYYPRTEAEFDALVAYNRSLREDCRARSGAMFDKTSAAEVAQDIDSIRRALGEEKISFYGVSYGTLMGQHYAERFGKNIRAMVIDSNMDHSLDTRGFVATEARAAEEVFQEWVKWNDRTPSSPLHGQDLRAIWKDLQARAERGELPDSTEVSGKLTPEGMGARLIQRSYGPHWHLFTEWVKWLVDNATAPTLAFAVDQTTQDPFGSIFCNDYDLRARSWDEYRALTRMENAIAPNTRGSTLGHKALVNCLGYPEPANPPRPLKIGNAPKILMTNSRYDPSTPYEWAVNAHRQSGDATVLVTYEGWGHGVYKNSDCARKISDDYLVSLTVPPRGTSCAAVEPVELAAALSVDAESALMFSAR